MIPALERWKGDHAMTKTTTRTAVAADIMLLDDWFDPIEDGVRERVHGFIETMLEEELDGALSRPRYGSPASEPERRGGRAHRRLPARPSQARSDGHVRKDRDRRAARSDRR